MTLRFAAARPNARLPLARGLGQGASRRAANDNGCSRRTDDLMLHAALRHFAEHGLSSARQARRQAEAAFFAGDRQAYDWWLGICRTLDRRIAEQLVHATAETRLGKRPEVPR